MLGDKIKKFTMWDRNFNIVNSVKDAAWVYVPNTQMAKEFMKHCIDEDHSFNGISTATSGIYEWLDPICFDNKIGDQFVLRYSTNKTGKEIAIVAKVFSELDEIYKNNHKD